MAKNPRLVDMTGRRFGRWLVQSQAGNAPRGGALWLCQCDCGTLKSVLGQNLRSGQSISCGCASSRATMGVRSQTHGESRTRLHTIWKGMRARCSNLANKSYGGRGISVCDEWGDYTAFRDWALANGYRDDLSIERKDVNGHYSPENCTWATPAIQNANRRFVQRAPDGELWWHKAKMNGVTQAAYRTRLLDGWTHAEASSAPMYKKRRPAPRDPEGRFISSSRADRP